ncbi:unnamed protein product [Ostreobium quekettii]|uniref:Uncharacterized protein n=1 Tax=Ostreobium quekettii TaxID=121088 RepID=A0A8S1IN69_9CHLO|nr:unnamed protein product [Ostreobium quekettii]|eukprot:evm.model.scf_26.4 EVM.evm.TU.scf_26.4   scf_26:30146-31389(+)
MAHLVLLLAVAICAARATGEITPAEGAAPADIEYINPPSLLNATELGYTQVVTAANVKKTVWISGQTSQDTGGNVVGTTLEEQADTTTANVKKALEAVGATVDNIVHIQVFIANYNPDTDIPTVAKVTKAFEGSNGTFPSAELIGVQSLFSRELLIEINAVAVLP